MQLALETEEGGHEGMQVATRMGEGKETDSSVEPVERNKVMLTLDFSPGRPVLNLSFTEL